MRAEKQSQISSSHCVSSSVSIRALLLSLVAWGRSRERSQHWSQLYGTSWPPWRLCSIMRSFAKANTTFPFSSSWLSRTSEILGTVCCSQDIYQQWWGGDQFWVWGQSLEPVSPDDSLCLYLGLHIADLWHTAGSWRDGWEDGWRHRATEQGI